MLLKKLIRLRGGVIVGFVLALVLSSCSNGPNLDESELARMQKIVELSAGTAGIKLTESDRDCVVEKTSTDEARQVLGALPRLDDELVLADETSQSMAVAVVECAGSDVLVQSGLLFFAGDISEESQACTGDTFDQDLLGQLIASFMSGTERQSTEIEIEIEIGLVLGECLTPAELLQLHKS